MTDTLETLSQQELKRLAQLLKEQEDRVRFNRKDSYSPYGWQEQFINASKDCFQLLAMTGNRCGKTYTGAYIMACHLTGLYPKWWKGRKFLKPIKAWSIGASTLTVRDILQSELLGAWDDPDAYGTGAIPKHCIVGTVNRSGVPGGIEVVQVRHVSGGISTCAFKSYEMTLDKFMGTSIDVVWLDEEAPKSIYTQCVTRTATTKGIVYLTFTPEHGLTPLVRDFMEDLKPGQFFVTASWDDAPHLDSSTKEQLLAIYSPEERKMRTQGLPFLGDGVCFPLNPEDIIVDPFLLPEHYLKIIGVDLGYSPHPNGTACVAFDGDTETYYLYDEHSNTKENISTHAAAIIRMGGDRIPVQLPHDAFKKDGANSGKEFIKLYAEEGVNCLPFSFSNPPGPDGKAGGNSVEVGVHWMLDQMMKGKFKVFRTCTKFLREMPSYHRKEGAIVPLFDDMISATRYAALSVRRFGRPGLSHQSEYYHTGKLTSYWEKSII